MSASSSSGEATAAAGPAPAGSVPATTAAPSTSTTAAKPDVAVEDLGTVDGPHIHQSRFSFIAIVGLAFAILNSWVAMSASLNLALPSGGPVAVLWGLIISALGVMAIAASLAEICAVLPSTGGPYHWAFALAPKKHQVGLAYFAGWITAGGWVALTATASSLGASFITGIISLMHPTFEVQPYQTFLLYVAFALGGWAVNVFGAKILDVCNRAALFWSLTGALCTIIVCLATASPTFRTGKDVFGTYVNTTGWGNFVAFMLGLLQSTFGLVGVDGATHMVAEMPRAHVNAPRAMLLAPAIGALTSWIVLMSLLFSLRDYDAVTESSAGALLAIIYQATANMGGSVALIMFPVISMCFTAVGLLTASSRTSQALAADNGLPFPRFFASETPWVKVPVPAITMNTVWVIIFGCVYLGSSSALNAILSASVVLLQFAYAIPILLLLVRGRHLLDEVAFHEGPRHFNLGKFGYPIGAWAVFFALFTDVFFLFPPERPVTGTNMNYTVVAVAVVLILAALSWIFHGRKHYRGPVNLDLALEVARRGLTRRR
ncbi:amino acid transporter [Jaminaea rosea]|uniref:Amino acid transporter n=1 Tax=Jaminaea rosea TaxID=1569628 RepID=A0A316UXQ7_9BASI|nr:amino acid transporter [Jaminaea rosea]PWN27925.1 amino acid transporter [Jaminaea rosea]